MSDLAANHRELCRDREMSEEPSCGIVGQSHGVRLDTFSGP